MTPKKLLQHAVAYTGWHIDAESIPAAAELLRRGHITAIDDYEGPRAMPTEAGTKAALRFKWVVRDEDTASLRPVGH